MFQAMQVHGLRAGRPNGPMGGPCRVSQAPPRPPSPGDGLRRPAANAKEKLTFVTGAQAMRIALYLGMQEQRKAS